MTKKTLPRLLIVEDDEGLLSDYKSIFRQYKGSLEVTTAIDASETLSFLNLRPDKRPDVMILDLMMPYGKARGLLKGKSDPTEVDTGLRLLEHLRKLEQKGGVEPIWVAVVTARSAYAVEERILKLLEDCGKLYLKPFDSLLLEYEVLAALGLRSLVSPILEGEEL